MIKKIVIVLAVVWGFAPAVIAAEVQPRLVSTSGEGEVLVVPDEVHINLQVETFDPVLAVAKGQNDDAVKKVLAIVKKHGVDDKDFRTDYFTVRNEERYYVDAQTNQQKAKRGFFVTKNVAVILRNISKFEALYSDALEAGVNNIYGVEFKTSKLTQYRDQARSLAVLAAREKAVKLARDLNQSIGRPYTIQENAVQEHWPIPMMMNKMAMAADSAQGGQSNETIALGQIKVTASVFASFELA